MQKKLPYVPQPRQQLLHNTLANEILYGGQAGGGKSHALRWDAIDFCISLPGVFAGLFRETLPMLEENHIVFMREELRILEDFYGRHIGKYNETRKKVEFFNGSVLRFKHLEYDKDCGDIQGWELQFAGIDEAAQMSPYRIGYVKSRIRMGQKGARFAALAQADPELKFYVDRLPRFALTSNPGGEGHHWLKENFIDPAPPETMFDNVVEKRDGGKIVKTRIFIPASMYDNSYLDDDYEAQFSDLPEYQQKQLRDGDWNVVPGAWLDCWSQENIIRPFQVPDHWTRLLAGDWGFRQPFWFGLFAVSDGTPVKGLDGEDITYPEDCLILIREWYGREKNNVGLRMDAYNVGLDLAEWGKTDIAVIGGDAFNHHGTGKSPAEKFADAKVYFGKADDDRVKGWQDMYSRVKDNMLLAFDTCHHFCRTVPTLEMDKNKPEDVEKKGEDHPGDGCRYGCMARPYNKKKPKKQKPWHEIAVEQPTYGALFDEHMRKSNNNIVEII